MTSEETMREAKEIFEEWKNKTMGEKLHILKSQRNLKSSNKVYLQMQKTIYRSVQAQEHFGWSSRKHFKPWDTKGVSQIHDIIDGLKMATFLCGLPG
jgi:hypothetical protein